jgi:hypothetical protein
LLKISIFALSSVGDSSLNPPVMEVLYLLLLPGLFLFINQQFVATRKAIEQQNHDLS